MTGYTIYTSLKVAYIDEVLAVSLLNVEENGGLVEITEVGHVLHSFHTGLVHGQHIVRGEGGSREREGLEGGREGEREEGRRGEGGRKERGRRKGGKKGGRKRE